MSAINIIYIYICTTLIYIDNFVQISERLNNYDVFFNEHATCCDSNKYSINDAKSRSRACYASIPIHFIAVIAD